jgi:hypothetical protein
MFTGTHRPGAHRPGALTPNSRRFAFGAGGPTIQRRDRRRYSVPGGSARSSKPLNVKAGHTVAPIRA